MICSPTDQILAKGIEESDLTLRYFAYRLDLKNINIVTMTIESLTTCRWIVSLPTPEVLLAAVRDHWAIENALHWQLDVSFREDPARNRKDNGPGDIAVLSRRALAVLRRDTSKGSLSVKIKRAGWDTTFLRSILSDLATT